VDIVSINEPEARQLMGTLNVVRAAREILALGPRAVIVKRGEHGATLFTAGGVFSSPAWPLEELTDPTGAGDTFAGGLLGYLSQQTELDDSALRRGVVHGNVCASFAVQRFSVDGIEAATTADVERRYAAMRDLVRI
jgi:sugar/nucleoside kinase (ribokinase family)